MAYVQEHGDQEELSAWNSGMQPAPGHTAWPWLMIRASARRRQSSCHNRGRSAADLPMRPTTHMVGPLSSGSPGITSWAGRRRVESFLATKPSHGLVFVCLAPKRGPMEGPKVPAHLPTPGCAARTCCGTISRPGCRPSWMIWALPASELVETDSSLASQAAPTPTRHTTMAKTRT